MIIQRFSIIIFIILSIGLVSGCVDEPNPVGSSILAEEDIANVRVDTLIATSHSSLYNLINTQGVSKIMLGKYQTYQAWMCIKFSGWPDSLVGQIASVESVKIQMRTTYHFGDSTALLSFSIHRAASSWIGDSLTLDSLLQNPSYYYDNNLITTTSVVGLGDTDIVEFDIPDTALVRTWFTSNTDTIHANEGLILRPTNSSVIKGFYPFNYTDATYNPQLIVKYVKSDSQTGWYTHKYGFSKYLSKVDQANPLNNNDLVYIQNGISYRGVLSFDSILIINPRSIYRAILEVTLNPTASRFNSYTYECLYARSADNNGIADGNLVAKSEAPSDINGQRVYKFYVTNFIKLWTKKNIRKITLSGYYENNSFDLFTLYGAGSNISETLRPKIIVEYSLNR